MLESEVSNVGFVQPGPTIMAPKLIDTDRLQNHFDQTQKIERSRTATELKTNQDLTIPDINIQNPYKTTEQASMDHEITPIKVYKKPMAGFKKIHCKV